VFEELLGDNRAHRVRSEVIGAGVGIAITIEAGHGIQAANFQGLTEDVALFHASTLGTEPRGCHKRRTHMKRFTVLVLGLIVSLALVPGQAQAAQSLTQDAVSVRSDILDLTSDYATRFDDHITTAESRQLRTMAKQARTEMNKLVRAVRRAERRDTRPAWRNAYATYEEVRLRGDTRLSEAREIIEPHLGFGERLQAWSDMRDAMSSMDSLGRKLAQRSE